MDSIHTGEYGWAVNRNEAGTPAAAQEEAGLNRPHVGRSRLRRASRGGDSTEMRGRSVVAGLGRRGMGAMADQHRVP